MDKVCLYKKLHLDSLFEAWMVMTFIRAFNGRTFFSALQNGKQTVESFEGVPDFALFEVAPLGSSVSHSFCHDSCPSSVSTFELKDGRLCSLSFGLFL